MMKQLFRYGAISGKIHAMMGNRMTPQQFEGLMQQPSVGAAAEYLMGTGWKDSLQGLESGNARRAELEERLRRGLDLEYHRLAAFASGGQRGLLRALASRNEAGELLRFLRFLAAGHPVDYKVSLPDELWQSGTIDYAKLSEAMTYGQMLEAAAGTEFESQLKKCAPEEGEIPEYNRAETAVQTAYYKNIFQSIEKGFSGQEQAQLKKYFAQQCDFRNIVRILRLKSNFHHDKQECLRYLLPFSYQLKSADLEALVSCGTAEEVTELLAKGPYARVFAGKNLQQIERYSNLLLQKNHALLHRGAPSAFTALVYLEQREAEMKSIIQIIECIRYQVTPSQMKVYLHTEDIS